MRMQPYSMQRLPWYSVCFTGSLQNLTVLPEKIIYLSCIHIIFLSLIHISLTLPGVAGIILSIGMAVDANVIIFTRIKEEIGMGKTVKSAIKTGFAKALSAIIDGNVTTLIAAAVLFWRGSGTVKGFALSLIHI